MKYNPSGVAQWARSTFNIDSYSTIFNSVKVDSSGNNIYAVGRINNNVAYNFGNSVTATGAYPGILGQNIVLVKYSASGNTQWAQTVSASTDNSCFNSIFVDNSSGRIYAAGYVNSNVSFNFGNSVTIAGAYNLDTNCVLVQY